MDSELKSIFQERLEQFRAEHGRDPGPDEKIFDGEPEHIEHSIVETMKKVGIDPAIIYAFEKTGRLVSEQNQHLLSDVELAEWNNAIDEYRARI